MPMRKSSKHTAREPPEKKKGKKKGPLKVLSNLLRLII